METLEAILFATLEDVYLIDSSEKDAKEFVGLIKERLRDNCVVVKRQSSSESDPTTQPGYYCDKCPHAIAPTLRRMVRAVVGVIDGRE